MSASEPRAPSLWTLVKEDFDTHGKDWTRPGFQAMAVYRFGVWRMSVRPRALRMPLSLAYKTMFVWVRNVYGIELPYTAQVGRRVVFEHQHGIIIHGSSVIGDECIIRQGVTLGIRRMEHLNAAPVLGRGVQVGAGAKILGHVRVGDEAAIGANAVVLHDVPPGGVVIGTAGQLMDRPPAAPVAPPVSIHEQASKKRQNGQRRKPQQQS